MYLLNYSERSCYDCHVGPLTAAAVVVVDDDDDDSDVQWLKIKSAVKS